MDKMREAFEAWAKANLLLADHFYARNQITDVYECDTVLFAWAAWKAAHKEGRKDAFDQLEIAAIKREEQDNG